jgi:hypothetical protein
MYASLHTCLSENQMIMEESLAFVRQTNMNLSKMCVTNNITHYNSSIEQVKAVIESILFIRKVGKPVIQGEDFRDFLQCMTSNTPGQIYFSLPS